MTETLNPDDSDFERITSYIYDNRGNRIRRTQPNGAITNYTYDTQNRLLSAVQDGAPEETRNYTYNAAGAITFVEEGEYATGYMLDKLGRTVEERTFVREPLGTNWIPRSVVTSTYDVMGNRLSVTYPNNRSLTSTYDLRNLLTSVSDGTRTTSYTYDAAGNRTSMTMPNGVVATYTFDSNNRLTKIEHENAAGTNLYTAVYTLDSAGMRTSITETGINRANRELNFSYDNLYQLIQESDSSRNNGAATTYSYDALGNRIQKEDNGVITTYTVDKLNRVTAATTGEEVISYSYDANGNTVAKTAGGVTHTYCYDRENRLTEVLAGEEEIFSAIYDYRSRRLEKHENGDTVSYLYDGGVSVQEYDAEGSLKTFLVRAGGYGGGIGDVVYTENGSSGEREYFLYNAIGSISALTDDSGSVISTTNYGAWGTETGTTGSSENVRKFSTKERSASIGLDYFGFRYYDYDLGRFTTRDPSGYPDGPNNYLYCSNNPVNKIDSLGLESSDMVIAFDRNRKVTWNLSGRLTRNRDMVNEELRGEGAMAIDTESHDKLEKIGAVTSTFVRSFTEELADNIPMGDVAAVVYGTHPGTNEPISVKERIVRGAILIPGMGVVGKGVKTAVGKLKRVADKRD